MSEQPVTLSQLESHLWESANILRGPVFAAQKLRMHAGLKNPTVLFVVDRIDLDSQITGTFTGADIPNLEKADSREKLQ